MPLDSVQHAMLYSTVRVYCILCAAATFVQAGVYHLFEKAVDAALVTGLEESGDGQGCNAAVLV